MSTVNQAARASSHGPFTALLVAASFVGFGALGSGCAAAASPEPSSDEPTEVVGAPKAEDASGKENVAQVSSELNGAGQTCKFNCWVYPQCSSSYYQSSNFYNTQVTSDCAGYASTMCRAYFNTGSACGALRNAWWQ